MCLFGKNPSKTGQRLAQVDKTVLVRDYGQMICGFQEVDSLVDDPTTGLKVGIQDLTNLIAKTAECLEHMGIVFNRNWRQAKDELLSLDKPHISFEEFASCCKRHFLETIETITLANLLNDLGYIVYYSDDEHLCKDLILQPEWLTKAIGFILEDRTIQEMNGVLPDSRLADIWCHHPFHGEPRFEPELFPFFLRLMEKFDVSYRLEGGNASLIAQHVPQVCPNLPWAPEDESKTGMRRIIMICVFDEEPPGLVPWMIVRTQEYACKLTGSDGNDRLLHWQKGMFLRHKGHGEAFLELRGREFHIHVDAVWPEYFFNVLRETLQKLIIDSWPGLKGRYRFTVPCAEKQDGPCGGRFDLHAVRQFLEEGDETIRCQVCRQRQNIIELLFGFSGFNVREQLIKIEQNIDRRSRI